MATPLLEIAAGSLASALAAQAGGAGRIELCANLAAGGITPSHGTIAIVRELVPLPLVVLIRPRAGDFVYDAGELESMRRDIEHCAQLGCAGVAIGVLDSHGDVDRAACARLIQAAKGMQVTFHRAFDCVRDRAAALETLIELGCARVLTSGAEPSAEQGADAIAASVAQAAGRIRVIAGAGVRPGNVEAILARARPDELHASASRPRLSRTQAGTSGLLGFGEEGSESDPEVVRALVDAIGRAARE